MLKRFFDKSMITLIVTPFGRRLGTALAVYLAAKGVPAEAADQLLTALGVVAGLAYDVVMAILYKQDVASRARSQVLKDFNIAADYRV